MRAALRFVPFTSQNILESQLKQQVLSVSGRRVILADSTKLGHTAFSVFARAGDIDILINNAGIMVRRSLLETEEDVWDNVIDTNLKGTYLCSQAVGRLMVEWRKGNIINISSLAGVRATPNRDAYSVAKAGVIMLTRVLACELGSYNIRVNAIAPWMVKTRMNEDLLSDTEFTKAVLVNTPLGRFGEPDDITGAALFLASDAASWITGQIVVVDGGYII